MYGTLINTCVFNTFTRLKANNKYTCIDRCIHFYNPIIKHIKNWVGKDTIFFWIFS